MVFLDFYRALTSAGQERNGADQSQPPPVDTSAAAVNKDRLTKKADVAAGPAVAESGKAFDDDVETYLDERGRLRVSKVRALGIRMTRDLQRNLDLMKEMDAENNEKENNESATTGNLSGVLDDSYDSIPVMEATGIKKGMNTEVDKIREPAVIHGSSIEISFEAKSEPGGYGDNDDSLFASLVAGVSIADFSVNNSMISGQPLHTSSDNEWEEGVIEGKSTEYQNEEEGMTDEEEIEWEEGDETQKHLAKGVLEEASALQEVKRRGKEEMVGHISMDDFHENHASEGKSAVYLNVGDTSDEGEVEWEEGSEDIQLKSFSCPSESNTTVTKGALEEEASLQEAIKRSLEDISGCRPMNDLDNISSERKTSSVIEKSPVRTNVDPNLLNQDAIESGALAEELLSTYILPGGDDKVQPLDTYTEDSDDFAIKKLVDASSENTGHETSSSALPDSSHERLLDSVSADAKNMFQEELHLGFSAENPGKTSGHDSTIGVDELPDDEIIGSFPMVNEVERNNYQDQKILEDRLEGEISFLGKEREELGSEQRRFERDAESVNNEMFTECQVCLLSLRMVSHSF